MTRKYLLLSIFVIFIVVSTFTFVEASKQKRAVQPISKNEHNAHNDTSHIVASVNGIPVEQEEFSLIKQLTERIVPNSGGTANQKVLDQLVKLKVAEQIAVQYGLLQDSSYAAFLAEFNQENERRANAIKNKEPIYGPTQYSKLAFYDYRNSVMMNALQSTWSKQNMNINEQQLVDYYNQQREALAKKQDTIQMYTIIQPKSMGKQAKQNMYDYQQKANSSKAFTDLFQQLESKKGIAKVETIQEDNYKEISKYRSEFYDRVNELPVGKISQVIEEPESYALVMITARQPGGYKSLAEIREEVIQRYTDACFASFLEQQVKKANVQNQANL
ncbi:hypothetical protein J2Z69_001090 [Paenibacillus shirakamiensis]|uniref:PpiC domain-containing protein n=1 Tax=Paenibacillus shirakamiensis TaxID=1265935 RepID=A0ABS4JG45_9BACL|nr:peptidylprolyl isomerase [Paenibacillus shirakamiensis]MBP2000071.1 hypothetical protein [Paenibacillus shirakamiensis]